MEALLALGIAATIFGVGVWLGWQLGDADRQILAHRLEQAEERLRGAHAAVETGRRIADALGHPDPRARVRGLLNAAGQAGSDASRPDPGAGASGDGLDLHGRNGDTPPGGPGATSA